MLARIVSRIVGQRVTDTTSGFQALNRHGIALFARDYPHDYPEVEATVMVFRHRLRLREVPVTMRERGGGRSSITALRSVYYMVKVLLAIFVGLFRRNVVPQEEPQMTPLAVSIAGAIASFTLVLVVLELIRSRRLRERYALLWLATGRRADRALGLARRAEHDRAAGSASAATRRRCCSRSGILFILAVLLHYSTVISRLSDQNVVLAQRLALLEAAAARRRYRDLDVDRRPGDVDVARGRVVDPARLRRDPVLPHAPAPGAREARAVVASDDRRRAAGTVRRRR